MDDNKVRGHRLRTARLAAGFASAREAALRMGWPESSYQQHESGLRGMKSAAVDQYAKAFNTTAAWIMFGTGSAPGPFETAKPTYLHLSENDVAPFVSATPDQKAMMQQIARAVAPLDHHPTYYLAQRTRADLLIGKGDILVLSLNAAPAQGDLVIIQLYDEAGEASTQLRQLLGNHLVADRDTKDRIIPYPSPNVLARGKVVAMIRAFD
jgi:hypothetical protein